MPRTSKKVRKNVNPAYVSDCYNGTGEDTAHSVRIYKTAIYVRLSREDFRKKSSGSAETQRSMLETFIEARDDLKLQRIYEDINYSGTNFKRPGFSEMMADVKAGLIDCIIVKDLSRLGRNFQETGYYLERVFPANRIRFISVSDNFDTLTASMDESCLIVPLKNLINQIYARDISRKVKSSFKVKQKKGEFCGAFAPYGYTKKGSSFVVDQDAAPIVKMIFHWRVEGMSIVGIVNKLNDLNVPPPSRYRLEKGLTKSKNVGITCWHRSTVRRLLANPGYVGDMVQARYKTSLTNGGRISETKEGDWITVRDTHEAIVDRSTFEAVQLLRTSRK